MNIESERSVRGRRAEQGARTRQAVIRAAMEVASVDGLEGLSFGRLASELGISKSGLFAHFGSKEELQLVTVDAARGVFREAVFRPALEAKQGLARLWRLCETWLAYGQGTVFRGGCFFAAASAEFDSRPGPVRDRLAAIMQEWIDALAEAVRQAVAAGELDPSVEPVQLAFELNALMLGANWALQLLEDHQAFARARTAMRERLCALATPNAPPLPN